MLPPDQPKDRPEDSYRTAVLIRTPWPPIEKDQHGYCWVWAAPDWIPCGEPDPKAVERFGGWV